MNAIDIVELVGVGIVGAEMLARGGKHVVAKKRAAKAASPFVAPQSSGRYAHITDTLHKKP